MKKISIFLALTLISLSANEFNPAMQEYINSLKDEAKTRDKSFVDFDAKRGEKILAQKVMAKMVSLFPVKAVIMKI